MLLQQLLIIMGMIALGYLVFRTGILRAEGQKEISALVVRVMNPFLMISSLSAVSNEKVLALAGENFLAVLVYTAVVIASGAVYFRIRKCDEKLKRTHQIMITLSNVGFFGIPLIRGLLGEEYVILLVFYIIAFNLMAYTYGIFLARKLSGSKAVFRPKELINAGTVAGIASVVIFLLRIPLPAPVLTFCGYLGDTCIPLSMFMIGGTLANTNIKKMLCDRENYILTVVKMLIVPFLGIMLFRLFPVERNVRTVYNLVMCMPVAAMGGMLCEEYGGVSGECCNRCIVMTTLSCIITFPLLSLIM